ncbi:MAG: hypothetical protein IJO32_06165 [Bacilli bacterium]|nr:hypothetical protein [Bacilli bacterium]
MIIEKNQIITLNNNIEYFVVNTIIYNNEKYALIININEDNDYLFVKQKRNQKLIIINDSKTIKDISNLLKDDINLY